MIEHEKIGPDVAVRYMSSLLRRIFVLLWIFWLLFSVTLSLYWLVKIFTNADIEFPRHGFDTTASVTLPESVVTAYKSGLMTTKDKREFEKDLRSGLIVPPNGTSLTIPSEELDIFSGSIILFAIVGIALGGIIVFQYLILGFANPQRLFRRSGAMAVRPN